MRRRPLLIAAVALTLVGGCTAEVVDGQGSAARSGPSSFPSTSGSGSSAPSSSAGAPTPAPADFTDCRSAVNVNALNLPGDRREHLTLECAQVSVPLDYSDPSGKTIRIQLIKVGDDRNTKPIGQLLLNPGGPGGSGVNLALGLAGRFSDSLFDKYDFIGFDPRGVGLSSPISCLSDAKKDELNASSPDVLTTAGRAQAKANAKEFATACSDKYGDSLPQYNTEQTARDMDQIRQAVGDTKMNYLGFSYGTELGAAYAHLFPNTIRVMVLDGAVNPLTDDITSFANQLKGFEGSFDQFATWCKSHSPCSTLGDPRQAVYTVAAAATKTPIRSSKSGETRVATSSIVYTAVLSALYSKNDWPTLGNALIDAKRGDSAVVFELADQYNERVDGKYTNIADANTTINCNDSKPGPTDAQIIATATSWKTRFPIFGSWSAPSLYTCQQWQPDRTPVPLPTAATPVKVLVVGNLNDPATPYQGALDLAKTMGNAQVLTWDGEGHTSYLQGSSCIDDAVNAYLLDATLPAANKTCPR